MVHHSQSYLNRRASIGKHKPIEDHIAHFNHRLLQRFDIEFTVADYYDLLSRITKGRHLYKVNSGNTVIQTEINGKVVWVLYGHKNDIQPARLKTVLIPYTGYIVPDRLSNFYDHRSFTVAMDKTMDYFIELSASLDINDPANKKAFFMQTSIHKSALAGAYFYKKHHIDSRLSMIKTVICYLKFLRNVQDDDEVM